MEHVLYQKGDKNIPSQLLDENGDVALSMCKICGKAESELIQECKSDREKAIEWWNEFSGLEQTQLCDTNTELIGKVRRRETLTGREIERIWRKETQQEHLKEVYIVKEEKQQVDFEKLLKTLNECACGERIACDREAQNLNLFVELLSKSSTFAYKAHKELNKLLK